ncbi:MAG: DUF4342 domain-containing protein [Firmicutes bacterium]|nr:DUF4342 domain-containing protein [Bacillota bacterium]
MNNELEKIDLIRERAGVSYREAKQALEEAGGDVVQALINLEESEKDAGEGDFTGVRNIFGHELMDNIKDLLQRGQATRIRIKQGERTVFDVPASVGALGLLAAMARSELALLGALGSIAAMSQKYNLEFDCAGKEAEDEEAEENMETVKKKEAFTIKKDPLQ